MNVACESCNNRFLVEGANGPHVIEGGCPDCGGVLGPERDQPSPTESDGTYNNPYNREGEYTDNPLKEGILADGGWQNRMKRDESFASVKKQAEWGGGFGIDFGGEAATATHKFVVDKQGQTYSLPEPTHHEDIAQAHNLIEQGFPRNMSLGLLKSDGSTDWYSHESGHAPAALAGALEGHFKQAITIDPSLKPTTSEERFNIPNPGDYAQHEKNDNDDFRNKVKREQGLVEQRGRPFGYYDNPVFNRGGNTLDQTIHYPWAMEKEAYGFGDTVDALGDVAGVGKDLLIGDSLGPEDALMLIPGTLGIKGAIKGGGLAAKTLGKVMNRVKGPGSALGGGAAATGGKGAWNRLKSIGGKARTGLAVAHGVSLMNSLLGGGGQQQGAGGGGPMQAPSLQQVSRVADTDTPTSLSVIPGAKSGDPEDADTQEFNDGDTDTNQENPNKDDSGVGVITPDSDSGKALDELLPNLIMYYLSDEAGENDPSIQKLDEILEREHPGYKDHEDGDDSDFLKLLLNEHEDHHHGALPAAIPPRPAPLVGPNPQQAACPVCGAVLDAAGVCQQCGFGGQGQANAQQINRAVTPGMTAKVADTQGPVTPEQQKAVAQFLLDQGRHDEIPTMLDPATSWQYADDLKQIQGDEQTQPPAVQAPSEPPAPPGMGMPPGMDPAAMGAPPDPSQQIAAAVSRFAADNIAPRCPECGSATTGILTEDGACKCHRCGNQFQVEAEGTMKQADAFTHQDLHATGIDDPNSGADNGAHNEADQDGSASTWETTTGDRLEAGREYEMHSKDYSVPDIIRIDEVKPTEIVYTIEGEFADLEDQTTIGREEAAQYGLTFVPVDGSQAPDDSTDPTQGDRTRHNTEATPESAVPFTSSVNEIVFDFTEDTPHEQVTAATQEVNTAGAEWLLEGTRQAAVPAPWEEPLPDLTDDTATEATGAEWLLDGVPASKVAGAKFSPAQQREFIDEDGEARNLDRLDLEDTHYRTRETSVFIAGKNSMRHADPDAVREDDFALGF